jgi:hypothetical protein
MKFRKNVSFIIVAAILVSLFAFTSASCMVKKDNGKHKGWYKNPKNPHHPATTNPKPKPAPGTTGKSKGKK